MLGEHYGVTIIPGIEISAYDYKNRKRVHILGYNIDLNSQEIKICAIQWYVTDIKHLLRW